MVQIQSRALAKCNQPLNTLPANLEYYQNIYVEAGHCIDRTSAMKAYYEAQDINERNLEMVLNQMESRGVSGLNSPITRNRNLLFHLSRGDSRKKESASVFFRIYALTPPELAKLGNGLGLPADAVEVIHIYSNSSIKVKVRIAENNILDRIEVDMRNFTINIGGANYQLIFDVVGIGYHLKNEDDKYRMVYYNDAVLAQPDIDLSHTVL